MTEPLKIFTLLPGIPDAEIWLHTHWIVVRSGDRVSCSHRPEMDVEESAGLAAALAEAAR